MIYFIKSQTDRWILPVLYLWLFNVVAPVEEKDSGDT